MLRAATRIARPAGVRQFGALVEVGPPGGPVPSRAAELGYGAAAPDGKLAPFVTNPPSKGFKGASRGRPDLEYVPLPSFVGMTARLWIIFFGSSAIGIPLLNDYIMVA